jgi:hypothetical protein
MGGCLNYTKHKKTVIASPQKNPSGFEEGVAIHVFVFKCENDDTQFI